MLKLATAAPAFTFSAGQYLCVHHPNGTQIPLSIASAPWQLPTVELLYRSDGSSDTALAFDELLQHNTALELSGPFGDVSLANLEDWPALRMIRMVAAGTGIAQVLSILSQLQHQPKPRLQIEVLWTTSIPMPAAEQTMQQASGVRLSRCTKDELAAQLRASANTNPDAFNLLAGTPDFVYQTCDLLLAENISRQLMAADAFSYAPR